MESAERHPIASPPPEPIGTAMSYDADVVRARRLMPMVREGFAASLTEAATRFALSHPAMGRHGGATTVQGRCDGSGGSPKGGSDVNDDAGGV